VVDWTLAFICLAVAHTALVIGRFRVLQGVVRWWPTFKRSKNRTPEDANRLLRTLDESLIFFPRLTDCLPYAAAGVFFLRCQGLPATLVIGVRHRPFSSHAWIELGSSVFAGVQDQSQFVPIDRW
jgi:hypothetical protein